MTDEHKSDCAVHNEPAYPNGPCDCGADTPPETQRCAECDCEKCGEDCNWIKPGPYASPGRCLSQAETDAFDHALNRSHPLVPNTSPEAVERLASDYDAGFLNDYGGGNVGWWQDYLRAEIGRANDYWRDQNAALLARLQAVERERDDWVALADKESAALSRSLRREESAEASLAEARAETAAVIEAAAQTCDVAWQDSYGDLLRDRADIIRDLTPAHATAALDEIKRQAREDALREAAAICEVWHRKALERVGANDDEQERHEECASTAGSILWEILALIEGKP